MTIPAAAYVNACASAHVNIVADAPVYACAIVNACVTASAIANACAPANDLNNLITTSTVAIASANGIASAYANDYLVDLITAHACAIDGDRATANAAAYADADAIAAAT